MSLSTSSMDAFLIEHRNLLTNCTLTCPSGHSFNEGEFWTEISDSKEETVTCPVGQESFPLSSILVVKPYSEERKLDARIKEALDGEVDRVVKMRLSSKIEEATTEDKKQIRNLAQLNLQYSEKVTALVAEKGELEAKVETLAAICNNFLSQQRKLIALVAAVALFTGYFFRMFQTALFNKYGRP